LDVFTVFFQLSGLKHNYLIAIGLVYSDQYEFAQKKFYWTLSNEYNFIELPDLNVQHIEFIDRDKSFFTGEPNRKLKQPIDGEEEQEAPVEEEEDEEGGEKKDDDSNVSEQEEIKVPAKELTEIDRVRFVVCAIENDCQVAPSGAFKMTAHHQLRRNEAFQGLKLEDGLNLDNYVHFRNVQSEASKIRLDEPSAPFSSRFLESISEDQPKGCWNFQLDLHKETALGRSLLWPGYHFYHILNRNKFGSVYIGNGLKNLELQFMTQ
jgi:radial spoke head protein 9